MPKRKAASRNKRNRWRHCENIESVLSTVSLQVTTLFEKISSLDRLIARDEEEMQLEDEYIWALVNQNKDQHEKILQKIAQKENVSSLSVSFVRSSSVYSGLKYRSTVAAGRLLFQNSGINEMFSECRPKKSFQNSSSSANTYI